MSLRGLVAVAVLLLTAWPARGDGLYRETLRIPMQAAGLPGLDALLIRQDRPGRFPLALISHGSPRDSADRATMSAQRYVAQASVFARHGFAALIVMRRGYGASGGTFAEGNGGCLMPNYGAAARASVADLHAAIAAMANRPDVTTQGMIAVGQSAGGFASVALAADPPPGLAAAISFAGGRGSRAAGVVCDEARLVETVATFGKTARVPMLWIYAQNDQYFSPALARQLHQAFTAGGGQADLVIAPAFRTDGHDLFRRGIDRWTPEVDRFLRAHKLGSVVAP